MRVATVADARRRMRGCTRSARGARREGHRRGRVPALRGELRGVRAALRQVAARPRAKARAGRAARSSWPPPAELGGTRAHGHIDRIDRAKRRRARDRADRLQDRQCGEAEGEVREPLEDTQLAFYAALVGERHRSTRELSRPRRAPRHPARSSTPTWRQARAAARRHRRELERLRGGAACRRSAKAAPATSARRAGCAGATLGGRRRWRRDAPACASTGRPSRAPLLRRRLRSAAQRRGRGLRRRGQDLDAGLAHAARLARRRRAAGDPGDHLHAQGGRRDAPAPGRMAGRIRRAARPRRRR